MKTTKQILKCTGILLLIITLLPLFSFAGSDKEKESDFRIAELKSHIYFLASDFLNGRVTGTEGFDIAAYYVQSQFKAAGLLPFIKNSDGQEAFLQTVSMTAKYYYAGNPIIVKSKKNTREFQHITDYKIFNSSRGYIDNKDFDVVFIGYGIEEEGWNDYKGIDVEDKVVLLLTGVPMNGDKPALSEEKHEFYSGGAGRSQIFTNLAGKNPEAIMIIETERIRAMYDQVPSRDSQFTIEYEGSDFFGEMQKMMRFMVVKQHVAEALLEGKHIDLDKIRAGDLKKYKTFEIPKVKIQMDIDLEREEIIASNVVGFLEGSDPELKDEYIVIGAHLDHVPNPGNGIHNGADDNASGIAAVIEIAEALAENPPKRSVVFAAFTGEEYGLYGSKELVNNFPVPIEQVTAYVNFDCIGRSGQEFEDRFGIYVLDTEVKCEEFREFIKNINATNEQLPLTYEKENRWGSSDHASFMEKDIPVVNFFNGGHEDLHQPTDDADKIDYEYLQKYCELGKNIVIELGNIDGYLCVTEKASNK